MFEIWPLFRDGMTVEEKIMEPDFYEIAAGIIFKLPVESVTRDQRMFAKEVVLDAIHSWKPEGVQRERWIELAKQEEKK